MLPACRRRQLLPLALGRAGPFAQEEGNNQGSPSHCQKRLSMLGETEARKKGVLHPAG